MLWKGERTVDGMAILYPGEVKDRWSWTGVFVLFLLRLRWRSAVIVDRASPSLPASVQAAGGLSFFAEIVTLGFLTARRSFRVSGTSSFQFRFRITIEGDVKACFDEISHKAILRCVREKVMDNKFLDLLSLLLKADVEIDGVVHPTTKGVPQGGVVSPQRDGYDYLGFNILVGVGKSGNFVPKVSLETCTSGLGLGSE